GNTRTLIKKTGIPALAFIEVLSAPVRGLHRAESYLRRLIVKRVEGLQLAARIARRNVPRMRGHSVIVGRLLGERAAAAIALGLRLGITAAVRIGTVLLRIE